MLQSLAVHGGSWVKPRSAGYEVQGLNSLPRGPPKFSSFPRKATQQRQCKQQLHMHTHTYVYLSIFNIFLKAWVSPHKKTIHTELPPSRCQLTLLAAQSSKNGERFLPSKILHLAFLLRKLLVERFQTTSQQLYFSGLGLPPNPPKPIATWVIF